VLRYFFFSHPDFQQGAGQSLLWAGGYKPPYKNACFFVHLFYRRFENLTQSASNWKFADLMGSPHLLPVWNFTNPQRIFYNDSNFNS